MRPYCKVLPITYNKIKLKTENIKANPKYYSTILLYLLHYYYNSIWNKKKNNFYHACPQCLCSDFCTWFCVCSPVCVVSEQPTLDHRESVHVHPLVLGVALTHTQHSEEVARYHPVHLSQWSWLMKRSLNIIIINLSLLADGAGIGEWGKATCPTWRALGPLKNPPEDMEAPCCILA